MAFPSIYIMSTMTFENYIITKYGYQLGEYLLNNRDCGVAAFEEKVYNKDVIKKPIRFINRKEECASRTIVDKSISITSSLGPVFFSDPF